MRTVEIEVRVRVIAKELRSAQMEREVSDILPQTLADASRGAHDVGF